MPAQINCEMIMTRTKLKLVHDHEIGNRIALFNKGKETTFVLLSACVFYVMVVTLP